MQKINEQCEKLEQEALQRETAMETWRQHAERCEDCRTRLEIQDKLAQVGNSLNEPLGAERFEKIREAVAKRKIEQSMTFPILKYVAVAVIILSCVLVFMKRLIDDEEIITEKQQEKKVEQIDLAWDYEQPIGTLKSKVARLKRKVYFSELRNKNGNGFYYRCRTIKKQAGELKNAKI